MNQIRSSRAIVQRRRSIQRLSSVRVHRSSFIVHHSDGQALVFVALVLSFVLMLTLTIVEIGARFQELAEIEDALKQATRSSVQTFDYRAFARNSQRVRETHTTSATGCAGTDPSSARYYAC